MVASDSTLISPETVELGRWVYSAYKHLRAFQATAVRDFDATFLAGRTCDLLGRMRNLAPYSLPMLEPLVRDSGFSRREFETIVIPLLEGQRVFQVARRDGGITAVRAVVLSVDDVMDRIGRLWTQVPPEPAERGAIVLLRGTAALPRTEDEALELCEKAGIDATAGRIAIERSCAYELLRRRHVADFNTEFMYNDFLWGENIDRTTHALAALPSSIRDGLRALLDELHRHEGRPTAEIESASPDLVRTAAALGLIDATRIESTSGRTAEFHFTPLFRGIGVSRDEIPDALDQVKLVVASFAFSTRYASFRLRDPQVFLDRLIERGSAGNATPIGTDYGAMERQKIVAVEPTAEGSPRHRFVALKKDTLIEARDTMEAGALLLPAAGSASGGDSLLGMSFDDPVSTRQRLGRRRGNTPLYDERLLAAIRDAAQRDVF